MAKATCGGCGQLTEWDWEDDECSECGWGEAKRDRVYAPPVPPVKDAENDDELPF